MDSTPAPAQQPITPPGLTLTFEAQTYLKQAAGWASFLGIVGFVMCGLMLIMAIFISAFFAFMAGLNPVYAQLPGWVGGVYSVILVLFDLVYFFFSLYLYQFASNTKKGLTFFTEDQLTTGLGKLKSFFKLWGILTIIVLSLYALIFIIAMLAGLAASHHY